MEERKREEINYYDKRAKEVLKKGTLKGDFEGFNPLILNSYSHLYRLVGRHCSGKKVLDYGCGNGIHSVFLAKQGAYVTAIDLSPSFLKIAEKKAETEGLGGKIKFLEMDCENLEFDKNYFDVVFDGGTFSSLDLEKAISEIKRVLRPGGKVICIETFGHNPFGNFKRKINERKGKRTGWASSHILKSKDIEHFKKNFEKVEVSYFHFLSSPLISFLGSPLLNLKFKIIDSFDRFILKIPFLKKYGFKVVVLLSNPKKNG